MKGHILKTIFFLSTINLFAGNPPESVIKALKQKFPSAIEINWHKWITWDIWEANFQVKERNASALFSSDGHWLYSRMEITFKEIGVEEVKSAILKDYPGCEITSVIINNSLTIGTWYNVTAKCNGKFTGSDYDYIGLPWPPRQ